MCRGIDDLLAQGRHERDPKKRAAIYHQPQRRIVRDAVCLPISVVPGEWARNPKAGEHAVRLLKLLS